MSADRLALGLRAVARRRIGVEVGDERRDERAGRRRRKRLAIGGRDGVADAAGGGVVGVAPAVGAGQALRARAEAGEPEGRVVAPGLRGSARASRGRSGGGRPAVVNASIRPSSAQRRSVSGSTPTSRLAGPEGQRASVARGRLATGTAGTAPITRDVGRLGPPGVGQADYPRRPVDIKLSPARIWPRIWVSRRCRAQGGRRIERARSGRVKRAVDAAASMRDSPRSGRDELVVVAMDPVAQAPADGAPSAGIGIGRMISRTSPFRQNR